MCFVVEPTQKRGKVATAQKKRTCCQINSPSRVLPINWTREEREGSFIVFSSVREKVKGRKHHAAATVNASAPVAAEVFLVEDSKTNAVFYFPARGFWSQEFSLPGFVHVFTGMYKAHGRRYLGGYIERPVPCHPKQLAPGYLLDKPEILPNLDDPDLSNLPGERVNHPKVGIIVICDGNVHSICASSVANKQAYADRHGYDMIYDEKIVDASRPASWSKILAMRKYLPKYDFLLYMDVDTIISNFDVRLEDIVDYEYDQILAADKNGLNCGVWMIRNTEWSLWFLDEMWSQSQPLARHRGNVVSLRAKSVSLFVPDKHMEAKSWRRTVRESEHGESEDKSRELVRI